MDYQSDFIRGKAVKTQSAGFRLAASLVSFCQVQERWKKVISAFLSSIRSPMFPETDVGVGCRPSRLAGLGESF